MPTYTYKCDECSTSVEILCSFREFPEKNAGLLSKGCACGGSIYRDFSSDALDSKEPECGEIYEWVSQKLPDGSTEVIPASRRLRDSRRKILPRPKDTWGK